MNKKTKLLTTFILGIAIGCIFSSDIESNVLRTLKNSNSSEKTEINTQNIYQVNDAKINICFTPPSGCAARIVDALNLATTSIYMQAYGLTHPDIAKALIVAKRRGVNISILLDRSNMTQSYSKMKELQEVGIDIAIDSVLGIAHNKIIIIDGHKVVTGSFNFTTSANTRNAENVLIIDSVGISETYLKNWRRRAEVSKKLEYHTNVTQTNTRQKESRPSAKIYNDIDDIGP